MKALAIAIFALPFVGMIDSGGSPRSTIDFENSVGYGQAYKNSDSDIQTALDSIATLTKRYFDLSGGDLRSLPAISLPKVYSENRHDYVLSPVGQAPTLLEFDPVADRVSKVNVSSANGSAVSVSFANDKAAGIKEGLFTFAGGHKHLQIYYTNNIPRMALPASGELGRAGVTGVIVSWDSAGNVVSEYKVQSPKNEFDAIREMIASLEPAQLDALDFPLSERLLACPAYQNSDASVKRDLEGIASKASRFIRATPNSLPEAFGDHSDVEPQEGIREELLSYRVDDGSGRISLAMFESASGHLTRVEGENDGSVFVFSFEGRPRFIAAHKQFGAPADSKWMVNFYTDWASPRIIVYTEGNPKKDLDDRNRKLIVWSPRGKVLLAKKVQPGSSFVAVLNQIDAALSDEQKQEIGWRGVEGEQEYLINTP